MRERSTQIKLLQPRQPSSLAMDPEEFRKAGSLLVNKIADFLSVLPQKAVNPGLGPQAARTKLENASLPQEGENTLAVLEKACELLFENSLFNGHPRFWGYITSSAAPISALADMLAAAVNPNVGAFALSPMATEIEKQTIQWLSEFIGYGPGAEGIFVSGGNMANFLGFLAARKAKVKENIREEGLRPIPIQSRRLPAGEQRGESQEQQLYSQYTIYCAKGTHTWIQKAADLFGHGTASIRWIEVNKNQQIECEKLEKQLLSDISDGHSPFLVIGNGGSVGTGVVDPFAEIAAICRKYNLWFHIDGAYGAPAAALPEMASLYAGLELADSIALDPHKWLYSALEAGCILVREPGQLQAAFSYHPDYYKFDGKGPDIPLNFFEYGMQNSRGFRALKVWMGLKQAGKGEYIKMIREDIALARDLFQLVKKEADLEAGTQNLSITTFRYVPRDLAKQSKEAYLNRLNEALLERLQAGGEVFLSNAVIDGKYYLRVCIVNFRTSLSDLHALIIIVLREGKLLDTEKRGSVLH